MDSTGRDPAEPSPSDASQPAPAPAAAESRSLGRAARARAGRILFNRRVVRAVGLVIVLGLAYYSLFVVLPSEVSWSTLWADLRALTGWEILALLASGLVVILALGWTSKASLPGLTLYQGTESSATSQMTAFLLPPPGDMLIRFAMYRTYGFNDERSAVAVLLAMVARYATVILLPILGLGLVLLSGQGTGSQVWWFLGSAIAFGIVMWILIRTIRSPSVAHAVGRRLQRLVARVMRRVGRHPASDLEDSVVRFGQRSRSTLDSNGTSLVAANLAWALSNALVMLLTLRIAGLGAAQLSVTQVIYATGLVMAINMLPIPGKDALAASTVAAWLGLAPTDTADFTTALVLYRVVTWLLPMAVGAVFFFLWRYHVRRDTVADPAVLAANDSESA